MYIYRRMCRSHATHSGYIQQKQAPYQSQAVIAAFDWSSPENEGVRSSNRRLLASWRYTYIPTQSYVRAVARTEAAEAHATTTSVTAAMRPIKATTETRKKSVKPNNMYAYDIIYACSLMGRRHATTTNSIFCMKVKQKRRKKYVSNILSCRSCSPACLLAGLACVREERVRQYEKFIHKFTLHCNQVYIVRMHACM